MIPFIMNQSPSEGSWPSLDPSQPALTRSKHPALQPQEVTKLAMQTYATNGRYWNIRLCCLL